MALSIKNRETDRLARELAQATGEGLTEAITEALRERLIRVQGRRRSAHLHEELRSIRRRCSALPILDDRSPEEILGYDQNGLPR